MWSKMGSFFKGFFHNVASDPVSSLKGVVSLAAAAGAGYAMSTGKLPIGLGGPMAASFAANGFHALGTDSLTPIITIAGQLAPEAMSITDHVKAIQAQAGTAQAVIAAVTDAQAVLAQMAPVAPAISPKTVLEPVQEALV